LSHLESPDNLDARSGFDSFEWETVSWISVKFWHKKWSSNSVKYEDNHLKTVKTYFANAVNTNEGMMGQKLRNIETDFDVGF